MRTMEERKTVAVQGKEADFGKRLQQYETEKLVQEMRALIKKKGLKVELIPEEGVPPIGDPPIMSGCTSCTICPCMICW